MVQLILGTVQLGLDYGINNDVGKPSVEKSFEILDYAFNNGISILDTANAYGDSEKIIGNYMKKTGNEFKISTKLSALNDNSNISKFITDQINSSLELLSKNIIDLYLIHNFNDLLDNEDLIFQLKKTKKVSKVGVSLYDPDELEFLLSHYCDDIDFVQIPFNILDSRWIQNDLLKRTKENGIKIFARSIFVQGLIFMVDENKMDNIHSDLKIYIDFISNLANEKQIQVSSLALDYVKSFNEIDGILVGCETLGQLKENIDQFNSEISVNDVDKENILELTKDIPKKIIDPRKW